MAIAAGSLDTLPHSAGLFLVLQVLGLNHKNSYRHMFWTSVAIPAVTVIVATLVCMAPVSYTHLDVYKRQIPC